MVCFALLYPDVLGYFHTIPYHSPTNKENNIFRMYCCSKNPHFPQVSMFKAVPNLIYWSICSRGPWKNHHIIHSPVMVDLSVEKQGRNPSRASRVFQRETSLKPAFRTCFENAPSKRGLRRNFFFLLISLGIHGFQGFAQVWDTLYLFLRSPLPTSDVLYQSGVDLSAPFSSTV